jgi:NADH dehydrogenase (ubiquinone) Fe-S protein 6
MIEAPETIHVRTHRVACDGSGELACLQLSATRVCWLEIDEDGVVECGYCDRRFVLIGGPADRLRTVSAPQGLNGLPFRRIAPISVA